jgi:hypothetical protein
MCGEVTENNESPAFNNVFAYCVYIALEGVKPTEAY